MWHAWPVYGMRCGSGLAGTVPNTIPGVPIAVNGRHCCQSVDYKQHQSTGTRDRPGYGTDPRTRQGTNQGQGTGQDKGPAGTWSVSLQHSMCPKCSLGAACVTLGDRLYRNWNHDNLTYLTGPSIPPPHHPLISAMTLENHRHLGWIVGHLGKLASARILKMDLWKYQDFRHRWQRWMCRRLLVRAAWCVCVENQALIEALGWVAEAH